VALPNVLAKTNHPRTIEENRAMDITPASLRDASFALTPSGCNPVQVEETLAEIAERLTNDSAIPAELFDADFETVSAGFSPDEVAEFFAALRETLVESTTTATSTPISDLGADESPEAHRAAEPSTHAEAEDAVAPMPTASTRPANLATNSGLPGAVERTKLAVSELETFVIHQMDEAKAALRLHIDQTQTDCQNTLDTARTVSDQALDTARQRAEVLLDVATRTTNQLRDRFDSELASMRAAFEEDLTRRHTAIRAELEALVTETRELTQEAHAQIIEVQEDVRASLEDARTVLTDPAKRLAA
jgi:hypothetical protein